MDMYNTTSRTPFKFSFEGIRYSATYIAHRFHDHTMYIVWVMKNETMVLSDGEVYTFRHQPDPIKEGLEFPIDTLLNLLAGSRSIPNFINRLSKLDANDPSLVL